MTKYSFLYEVFFLKAELNFWWFEIYLVTH